MADQPDAALQPILTKLAAARTRLIMERPFLGALVMHLPLKVGGDGCTTTGTDAQAFYFNPKFVENLSLAQTQFVLAHEAMHCAMGHPQRRNHRMKRRWDVACDHAVNLILIEEGLKPPLHGILADQNFMTLSAEEIYPLIPEDTPEESFDQHLFDNDNEQGASPDQDERQDDPEGGEAGGQGKEGQSQAEEQQGSGSQASQKPNELSPSEREELAEQWKNGWPPPPSGAPGRQTIPVDDALGRRPLGTQFAVARLVARFFAINQRDDYSCAGPRAARATRCCRACRARASRWWRRSIPRLDQRRRAARVRHRARCAQGPGARQGDAAGMRQPGAGNAPWEFEPWDTMQPSRRPEAAAH